MQWFKAAVSIRSPEVISDIMSWWLTHPRVNAFFTALPIHPLPPGPPLTIGAGAYGAPSPLEVLMGVDGVQPALTGWSGGMRATRATRMR